METFLFSKSVDQSLLKSGLTVPKEACDRMQASLGIMLNKGDQQNLTIRIDGKLFDAKLVYVNLSPTTSDRTVFQIRYATQSDICIYLNSIYPQIVEYIKQHDSDDKISVPSEIQEKRWPGFL